MKKYVLLMTLLLALLLTACGQKNAPPVEKKAEAPPAAETAEQKPEVLPAPPVQSKPAKPAEPAVPTLSGAAEQAVAAAPPAAVALKFMVEGVEETLEANRHEGNGYALYIPAEGWRLEERELDDGVFEEIWESTVNDDAELWVLSLGQRTLAEGQAWLKAEEDDFALQEDKQGGLWGADAEDGQLMEVRFHEGGGALYAVVWTYPEAAAEGFGTRLSVIADTFELTT